MRTVVTFESEAFNTTEPKDYSINPGCFGDDVCRWLIEALRSASIGTDDAPRQEDFGWYFNFSVPEGRHCCVVGYRPSATPDESGTWIAWLERDRGFVASLLGGRQRGIADSASTAIHSVLATADRTKSVRWHLKSDFDQGREEVAAPTPR